MQHAFDWAGPAVADNPIEVDLPMLLPLQRKNVLMIEERFKVGRGRIITDGTGTGKTYTGMGTIRRFVLRGKYNVLIVVPTDDKCKDWIEVGHEIGVETMQLSGISDRGYGVRVTTYANFYQNEELPKEEFDLIVYDESHYIMQNGKGHETSCFSKHKLMCSLPSRWKSRGAYFYGDPPHDPEGPMDLTDAQHAEMMVYDQHCRDKGKELYYKCNVLYLSATPFAYHKSIRYADGTVWIVEENPEPQREQYNMYAGYNVATGFDKFLQDNFGYFMKNGKLRVPEPEVDQGLLEREFFERAKKQNLMSTNMLDVDFDYSRHFIKVESDLGQKMDEFIALIHKIDDKEFQRLNKVMVRHFSYMMISKMLESGKAENIIERIHWHLMLERKVVIFHGFNKVSIPHPFYIEDSGPYLKGDEIHWRYKLNRTLRDFYDAYPEWKDYDLTELRSVPEIIKEHYGERCVVYNGKVAKGLRRKRKDKFMESDGGVDIIVIQSQAGKEGISLHDIDGEKQRVMIDLSLPVRPTESIQKEGRTYRHGVMSNAIYEYPTLQTDMERMVFAYTIATRSKTVENLAMGNLARDLETAFKQGYENFEEGPPNIVQGREGKREDKKMVYNSSPFDKAITYYWQKQKANSKNKKGNDYFATPEPIGQKMVEWANDRDGLRWLEPSCGDGAISRFFPPNSVAKGLDVNFGLLSLAKLKSNITTYHIDFMEYKIGNKFDRIVMNPPFGHGGKTAVEHLLKGLLHLSKLDKSSSRSRLYCILPVGPSCQKHFDRMVNSENMKFFDYTGEILLPKCTFKRAGTGVLTRIVRFDGNIEPRPFRSLDYTHIQKIDQLFDEFRNLNF